MNEKIVSFTKKTPQPAVEVEAITTITLCAKLCGVNIATINNAQDGRFTLMIDGWKELGAAKFDLLEGFCEQLMGCAPICRYDVSYASGKGLVTIIEWRTKPEEETAFLRMLVNSRGFIRGGYENLHLFGGRNAIDYRNLELAQYLAICAQTQASA